MVIKYKGYKIIPDKVYGVDVYNEHGKYLKAFGTVKGAKMDIDNGWITENDSR